VVLRRGGKVSDFDLEPKFRGEVAPPPAMQTATPANPYSVEDNEKRLVREALMKARGNRTKAAKLMGISRRTLHRKLAEWPELDVLDRG
jgi:DNA-binding NtrC family response regulator